MRGVIYARYSSDNQREEPIDMPTTEEIEFMDQSSDIASAVSPKKNTTQQGGVLFCSTIKSKHRYLV